jgi:hypothetical protein
MKRFMAGRGLGFMASYSPRCVKTGIETFQKTKNDAWRHASWLDVETRTEAVRAISKYVNEQQLSTSKKYKIAYR